MRLDLAGEPEQGGAEAEVRELFKVLHESLNM
jgi:hypothetical protein